MKRRGTWLCAGASLLSALGVGAWALAGGMRDEALQRVGSNTDRSADDTNPKPASPRQDQALPLAPLEARRPRTAPVKGRDEPFALPDPTPSSDARRAHYREQLEEGSERPGERALRATINDFLVENRELAKEQAAREGLTVDEVEELTQFGFLVEHTQRWDEVEDLLDAPLDDATKLRAEALMQRLNVDFKDSMRTLVAAGAPESERWALIRATEARYRRDYLALTGLDEQRLDDLFAPDLSRDQATAAPELPDDGVEPPSPSAVAPARPEQAPANGAEAP